jgi:hypothetical protein
VKKGPLGRYKGVYDIKTDVVCEGYGPAEYANQLSCSIKAEDFPTS